MDISKMAMLEVIESDKDIIERLTKELFEAKELIKQKDDEISFLHQQVQQLSCCIMNEPSDNNKLENYEIFIKLKKDRDKYRNDFEKINLRVQELEKKKFNEDIFSEDKTFIGDKIQVAVDEALNKQKEEIKTLKINNKNLLKHNNELLANISSNIPTPSNSDDIKNNNIIKLPENILEVIYYRYSNNNKYIHRYFIENGKKYLKCCNQEYKNNEIDKVNITCKRCFITYILINDKFDKKILPEHIISNEKELLNKIKCNNCDYISKKEILKCNTCNKIEKGQNFLKSYKVFTAPSNENIGYNTKILAASETFVKLEYLHNLYYTAQKDGIDTSNMKELIEYIKLNKLLEEKQYNIIKFKIQRAHSIMLLYKDEKYKPILEYIKRINFKVKEIGSLLPEQWNQFRIFIEKDLNEELEKNNINYNNNEKIVIEEYDNKRNKNNNKENKSKWFDNLCNFKDCRKEKHKFGKHIMRFCINHMEGLVVAT